MHFLSIGFDKYKEKGSGRKIYDIACLQNSFACAVYSQTVTDCTCATGRKSG